MKKTAQTKEKSSRRQTRSEKRMRSILNPQPEGRDRRTILLAVSGMSPAILTETVWALAHPSDSAHPVTIPDDIIVITTLKGEADLNRDLFTPIDGRTVWGELRRAILGPRASSDPRLNFKEVRVISTADPAIGRSIPLDDIRTPQQNEAAAEFILDEIRGITTNDDTRLICSLAGGRKTMGSLLAAALSLLGRTGDRLTHVLVSEPFENPRLTPKFFFPTTKPQFHRIPLPDGTEETVSSDSVVLQLADVPFVPLRYLFQEQLGRFPGGFMSLVKIASNLVRQDSEPIEIGLDEETWTASFDGTPVELSGRDIPFFEFLLGRARAGCEPFATHQDAEAPFAEFLNRWAPKHPQINLEFAGANWRKQAPVAEDFRKRLNSLRDRLRGAGLGHIIKSLLPPHGPLGFPPLRVTRPSGSSTA